MIFLLCNVIIAQVENATYMPDQIEELKEYLLEINDAQIDKIVGKNKSEIKKVYEDRDKTIFITFKDSAYIFSNSVDDFISNITEKIYASNPEIDHKTFRYFIRNDVVPNARSFGNGMFDLNLGLLSTLEHEGELAFVICHEIAHYLLDHSYNSIAKSINDQNSDEMKARIKELKDMEYGRTRAAMELIDEINAEFFDHSKEIEAEADSLGYLLYSKTDYNIDDVFRSLEKLKLQDDIFFSHNVPLDSIYNFQEYPFKDFWIKEEPSIFVTGKKIDEFAMSSDSLKSHPEIEYRIQKLKEIYNIDSDLETTKKHKPFPLEFDDLVTHLKIQYTLDLKNFDLGIYEIYNSFIEGDINKAQYFSYNLKLFKNLYLSKKNHTFGKYVQNPNNLLKEKNLNFIRKFLHNLELREIKRLGAELSKLYQAEVPQEQIQKDLIQFFNI